MYDRTKELTVYVAEGARRRGVGLALYEHLIALHQRLGFRQVGRLSGVGHEFGRFIDTSFWQRILGTPPGS